MKNSIILFLIVSLVSTAAKPVYERVNVFQTIAFGLSPHYTVADNIRTRNALFEFVLQTAPPGVQIRIDDAYDLQNLVTFNVPKLSGRYDSAQSRATELKDSLAALALWFKQRTNDPAFTELKGSAALRVTEWMDQIRPMITGQRVALVLIGSPLRTDPREPAFNMAPDLYPSDRHLTVDPEDSVFSVSSKTNALDGRVVHWAFLSEGVWANELHAQQVRRFWTLWTAGQKGVLASFSADLKAVLALAPQGTFSPLARYEIDPTDQKLTMRTALAREIPRWLPAATSQPAPVPSPSTKSATERLVNSSTARPDSQRAIPALPNPPTSRPAGDGQANRNSRPVVFAVGLMWDSRADVDLYLRPQPGKEELCFARLITPYGRYIHDFRDRNSNHDYEWVELWEDVDPGQVEAWINLFEGSGPVNGSVSVLHRGKRYEGQFSLDATRGNHGADHELPLRVTSPCWCKINLLQILVGESK